MKKKVLSLLLAVMMIMSSMVVFAEEPEYAIQIVSGDNVTGLTLEELKAMPEEALIAEEYDYNTKGGEKKTEVKGVSLAYILKEKAGIDFEEGTVEFEALDGYEVAPHDLKDVLSDELKYVVVYEENGEVVDDDENPETDDLKILRKQEQPGEFGTVYKMISKVTVNQAEEAPVEETPAEEVDVNFTDITEDFKFAESAILDLAKRGIINGMGDGKYAPAGEFTRAQFCKVMVESLGYELKDYTGEFTDVNANDWFAPYVQAAVDTGLFTGYPDGTFNPNKTINRQEMAAVAGRAAVLAEKATQEKLDKFVMEKSNFADKDLVQDWAANEIAWLESEGVFSEVAGEKFEPTKVVNRAEAAVIVYNTLFK